MSLGRRDFIKTAAAFGAAGPVLAQGASAPNLRVGILSDIHVTALLNADWFEKALRYFDGRTVPQNGTPKYDFAARAAAARAPVFPVDAEVSVAEIDDGHRRNKAGTKLGPKPRKQVIASFPPIVTGAAIASPWRRFST